MRKHRVIRQAIGLGKTFAFDIETGAYQNIMVTWDDSAGVEATGGLVLCPTINRPFPLSAAANFPGTPAPPAAGAVVYASIGVNGQIAFPLPDMLTVGVFNAGGASDTTIKVEGDYYESSEPDPTEDYTRNRR